MQAHRGVLGRADSSTIGAPCVLAPILRAPGAKRHDRASDEPFRMERTGDRALRCAEFLQLDLARLQAREIISVRYPERGDPRPRDARSSPCTPPRARRARGLGARAVPAAPSRG